MSTSLVQDPTRAPTCASRKSSTSFDAQAAEIEVYDYHVAVLRVLFAGVLPAFEMVDFRGEWSRGMMLAFAMKRFHSLSHATQAALALVDVVECDVRTARLADDDEIWQIARLMRQAVVEYTEPVHWVHTEHGASPVHGAIDEVSSSMLRAAVERLNRSARGRVKIGDRRR